MASTGPIAEPIVEPIVAPIVAQKTAHPRRASGYPPRLDPARPRAPDKVKA